MIGPDCKSSYILMDMKRTGILKALCATVDYTHPQPPPRSTPLIHTANTQAHLPHNLIDRLLPHLLLLIHRHHTASPVTLEYTLDFVPSMLNLHPSSSSSSPNHQSSNPQPQPHQPRSLSKGKLHTVVRKERQLVTGEEGQPSLRVEVRLRGPEAHGLGGTYRGFESRVQSIGRER